MKIIKTATSLLMIFSLIFAFSAGAFAEEYCLDKGDITVSSNLESGEQQVFQENVTESPVTQTTETVIKMSEGVETTSNTVYIDVSSGDVDVTFEDVTITKPEAAITVMSYEEDGGDATLKFSGENNLSSSDGSAIYASAGYTQSGLKTDGNINSVTIEGVNDGSLNVKSSNLGIDVNDTDTVNIENIDIKISDINMIGMEFYNDDVVNISNSDINIGSDVSVGISLNEVVTLNIDNSDININVNNGAAMQLNDVNNVNINNSNIDLKSNEFFAVFILDTKAEDLNLNLKNCEIISPKEYTLLDVSGDDFKAWTIADKDNVPVSCLKIARVNNSILYNVFTKDVNGVSEGKSFTFKQSEKDLKNIVCNGKILVNGTDYTVTTEGDMITITFTDAFFTSFGDGPLPITISFVNATYLLTAINK